MLIQFYMILLDKYNYLLNLTVGIEVFYHEGSVWLGNPAAQSIRFDFRLPSSL